MLGGDLVVSDACCADGVAEADAFAVYISDCGCLVGGAIHEVDFWVFLTDVVLPGEEFFGFDESESLLVDEVYVDFVVSEALGFSLLGEFSDFF